MEVDDFLEHFGKKGMKWGVRKEPISASGERHGLGVTVRGLSDYTNKEDFLLSNKLSNAVHSLAFPDYTKSDRRNKKKTNRINDGLDKIDKKYPNINSDAEHRAYRSEVIKHFTKELNRHVPSGFSGQVLQPPNSNGQLVVVVGNKAGLAAETKNFTDKGFTHSDETPIVQLYTLKETLNESKHIVGIEVVETNLSHDDSTDTKIVDFLSHYGVQGMHWGVRRSRGGSNDSLSSGPVKIGAHKPAWQSPPVKKAVPTHPEVHVSKTSKKGKPLPSHDAVIVSNLRKKAKKHGLHTLTNEEIKVLTARAELASKYAKSYPKKPSLIAKLGKTAVNAALSDMGTNKITNFIGGPHPRTLLKTQNADKVAGALAAVKVFKKVTAENK